MKQKITINATVTATVDVAKDEDVTKRFVDIYLHSADSNEKYDLGGEATIVVHTTNEPRTYRLGSSSLINAVGIFRAAKDQYPIQPEWGVNLLQCWDVPEDVCHAVLSGETPVTFEGENVVFTYPPEKVLTVHSTYGDITIDALGNVIDMDLSGDENPLLLDDCDQVIFAFDLEEYQTAYADEDLPDEFDILDLGCWATDGDYNGPEQGFRREVALAKLEERVREYRTIKAQSDKLSADMIAWAKTACEKGWLTGVDIVKTEQAVKDDLAEVTYTFTEDDNVTCPDCGAQCEIGDGSDGQAECLNKDCRKAFRWEVDMDRPSEFMAPSEDPFYGIE